MEPRAGFLGALSRFGADQTGSLAVLLGLAFIPIMIAAGAAVDYSYAGMVKSKLDAAADAAVLAAVDYPTIAGGASGQQAAQKTFAAQSAGINRVTVGTVDITITNDSIAGRTAVLNYSATMPTAIMSLIGMSSMTIKGTATANSATPIYMDFYLLLDNTPSMGVGATPNDVALMVNNTPDKCAFACRDQSNSNNYYNLAKTLGVTMRIDVLRTATQQLMDTAEATEVVPNQFRMGIYTFGTSAQNPGFTTVAPLAADLKQQKTLAAAIDLMQVPYQNYNNDMDTDYDGVLSALNAEIKKVGNGSSVSSAQPVVFFVSDGVADENNPSSCSQPLASGGRCQEPINLSLCATMKDRGIKVAVLYTTYLPLPTNTWYNTWVASFVSNIGTKMQSCASPGLYFEVSPTQGISEAMTALFKKAVGQARLTR